MKNKKFLTENVAQHLRPQAIAHPKGQAWGEAVRGEGGSGRDAERPAGGVARPAACRREAGGDAVGDCGEGAEYDECVEVRVCSADYGAEGRIGIDALHGAQTQ